MAFIATTAAGTCAIESAEGSTATVHFPYAVKFPYNMTFILATGVTPTGITAVWSKAPSRAPSF